MEKLDINNILEAQEIKNLIRHKKKLMDSMVDAGFFSVIFIMLIYNMFIFLSSKSIKAL